MNERRVMLLLWPCLLGVAVALCAANLLRGELNQDEGWYLYAARMVAQGRTPYVDFASTQGPVMPYVYRLAVPMVDRWGMAGGRLFTSVLGFASALGAAWLASRLVPASRRRGAALTAFALVGVNVYQSYFTTIVKTYALTAFLLVCGFLILTWPARGRRLTSWLGGVLLALAAATRTSAGAVLPVVFIAAVVAHLRTRRAPPPLALNHQRLTTLPLWFAAGAAVTLALAFLPFALRAPQAIWFALFEYHAGRETGGLAQRLAYKGGFVSRLVGVYLVWFGTCAAALAYRFLTPRPPTDAPTEPLPDNPKSEIRNPKSGASVLFFSVLAVTLLHLAAPFPYDDYQTVVYPLAGAALAALLGCIVPRTAERWLVPALCLVCVGASLSSPINQSWFIGERDRIWWPMRTATPLQRLRQAAGVVRSMAGPDELFLTQDTYLAVEAGRSVPRGLELGPFSYFPGWSTGKCRRLHVLNEELLDELLRTTPAPVAALSGYSMTIAAPAIAELPAEEQRRLRTAVESRYSPHTVIERFGQADTTLRILRLRDGG